MADGSQGPLRPEIAQQLAQSPFVKEDSTREQLSALATPLMNEPQETPEGEDGQVPESREEFIQGLTEVPTQIDPAIEEKAQQKVNPSPETLTREDRQELIRKTLDQRMMEKINSGEVPQDEAMKFLQAKAQMEKTEQEDVKRMEASKVDGRQQIIDEKYQKFLEEQSARDEYNQLAGQFDGLIKKPEANILEFLDESDLRFAAESGMDIPPAAAYKAEKELEQLDLATEKEEQAAANRTLAAEQEAQQKVAVEQQQKEQQKAQIAAQEVEKEDQKMRNDFTSLGELFEEGTTGQKLSAAFAIMLGGLSQGMTGASINPAMAVLDKQFGANEAKKQRAVELFKEKVDAEKNNIKDQMQLMKMQKLSNDLEIQSRQLQAKRQFDKIVQQGGFVPDSLLTTIGADKDSRDRIVRGPDGKAYIADNKQAATDLRKAKDEAEPAIQGIDDLIELSQKSSRLNLKDRAVIYSRVRALVGKLRIPLTGPGVLTDTEYERLLDTLGDPNKIIAFKSIEEEKLKAVRDILQTDLKTRYRNAGVELPMSRKEKIIKQVMKANPAESKATVIRTLRRKGMIQ